MFQRAKKNASRLWIQDGDPSHNSAVARRSLKQMNAQLISIPPRSPDVNPIENIFHIVKKKLDDDAFTPSHTQGRLFSIPLQGSSNHISPTQKRFEILKEQMDIYKFECARGAGFRIIINRLETLRNWNISLSTARTYSLLSFAEILCNSERSGISNSETPMVNAVKQRLTPPDRNRNKSLLSLKLMC